LSTSYAEVGLSGLPPIRRIISHDPHARVCLWFDLIIVARVSGGNQRALKGASDQQRIVRQFECLAMVWLQAERRPHSADRGVGKARCDAGFWPLASIRCAEQ
jgi:hypothetical protein